MLPELRRVVSYDEDFVMETAPDNPTTMRMIGVAAVITNKTMQYANGNDMSTMVVRIAPVLEEILTQRLMQTAGDDNDVLAYGKACISGDECDMDQGSALLQAINYDSMFQTQTSVGCYLGFSNKRRSEGAQVKIPLFAKGNPGGFSPFPSLQFSVEGAPKPDEMVIALGAAFQVAQADKLCDGCGIQSPHRRHAQTKLLAEDDCPDLSDEVVPLGAPTIKR